VTDRIIPASTGGPMAPVATDACAEVRTVAGAAGHPLTSTFASNQNVQTTGVINA
jgi:hypothetical protein